MRPRAAGHAYRTGAVEFIANGLPFLPREEFGKRHGLAQGGFMAVSFTASRLRTQHRFETFRRCETLLDST